MPSIEHQAKLTEAVFAELRRAESLHPAWPDDPFRGLAIVGEEFGEAQQAALDASYGRGTWQQYRTELIQLAAMSLRLLWNMSDEKEEAP